MKIFPLMIVLLFIAVQAIGKSNLKSFLTTLIVIWISVIYNDSKNQQDYANSRENESNITERYRCREYLGCWKDTADRAISGGFEHFGTRTVENCHDLAATRGNSVFAVQATVHCFTAADAEATYQKYGQSTDCYNGVGGPWANDVYKIASCKSGNFIFSFIISK